ncbi:sigma-70 family RNA polymerase sigma factor [Mycetocola tolaasinivorans]|uniref:Sigma-70 family RNA polymerase sigma factor n=1 Tax=Mycetocola tolaasinivorans TaxID=76635 RepID=A0A3L7A8J2_9MICO|nr:ECF RNA polymerase sigma factor SigK [Mycetocola tolaasinivorans]RLP76374.1 sigma-70 family RNA polymerase sigma factor [Mycetocola tolaasinivorans]
MSDEFHADDHGSPRLSTAPLASPESTDLAAAARGFLLRVQSGDRDAFAALYDLFVGRVLGLVRHVLVDHAQSEEVTQEVFLEVWQRASTFDPERGSVSGWLMTLAHRRAVDRVRSAQAGRNRDERIGIRDFPEPVDEVSETVEIRVEYARVEVALRELTVPQREAVTLAYYEGFTQTQIAERLKIPLGTVKTRIRDGMIKLRQILGEEVTP